MRRRDYTDFHRENFTTVKRVVVGDATVRPFKAQALEAAGWRNIGQADTLAAAEALARGWRIDRRRDGVAAQTRVTEQRHPGGFAYIAV